MVYLAICKYYSKWALESMNHHRLKNRNRIIWRTSLLHRQFHLRKMIQVWSIGRPSRKLGNIGYIKRRWNRAWNTKLLISLTHPTLSINYIIKTYLLRNMWTTLNIQIVSKLSKKVRRYRINRRNRGCLSRYRGKSKYCLPTVLTLMTTLSSLTTNSSNSKHQKYQNLYEVKLKYDNLKKTATYFNKSSQKTLFCCIFLSYI